MTIPQNNIYDHKKVPVQWQIYQTLSKFREWLTLGLDLGNKTT